MSTYQGQPPSYGESAPPYQQPAYTQQPNIVYSETTTVAVTAPLLGTTLWTEM